MIQAVIFDMFETLITHYDSPLYFGAQMAEDAGIAEDRFQALWHSTEYERTIGKVTLEEVLKKILSDHQCYSETLLKKMVDKRVAAKEECFRHLHNEIIPMLSSLKEKGIRIGLISNCFSEEADVIRRSVLFPYFDAVYLSYEQGIQKPDEEIFRRCMNELSVTAKECIYVGDGGSQELETARKLGMEAVQATWYLREGTTQPAKRMKDFLQMDQPLDVIQMINKASFVTTERLNIYPLSNLEMEHMIEKEPNMVMKQVYSGMLDACKQNTEQRIWYAIWNMQLKDETGKSVGDLSFKGLSSSGMVEIGYGIKNDYEGQGYMTEAVAAMARWASKQNGVNFVEAETEPDNIASQRVLEKAGFQRNGLMGAEGPRFIYEKA